MESVLAITHQELDKKLDAKRSQTDIWRKLGGVTDMQRKLGGVTDICTLIKKIFGSNIIFQNYINHGQNYIPQKLAQNYTKLYKIIQKLYCSQKNSSQAVEIY